MSPNFRMGCGNKQISVTERMSTDILHLQEMMDLLPLWKKDVIVRWTQIADISSEGKMAAAWFFGNNSHEFATAFEYIRRRPHLQAPAQTKAMRAKGSKQYSNIVELPRILSHPKARGLYLRNLSKDVTSIHLRAYFSVFGKVNTVRRSISKTSWKEEISALSNSKAIVRPSWLSHCSTDIRFWTNSFRCIGTLTARPRVHFHGKRKWMAYVRWWKASIGHGRKSLCGQYFQLFPCSQIWWENELKLLASILKLDERIQILHKLSGELHWLWWLS